MKGIECGSKVELLGGRKRAFYSFLRGDHKKKKGGGGEKGREEK